MTEGRTSAYVPDALHTLRESFALHLGATRADKTAASSAMFEGAALYGAVTKRSLTGLGGFLSMALIGLVVAMIPNVLAGPKPRIVLPTRSTLRAVSVTQDTLARQRQIGDSP